MSRHPPQITILQLVLIVEVCIFTILMSLYHQRDSRTEAAGRTLTRQAILLLRSTACKLDQRTRLHIHSLGCAARRRGTRGGRLKAKLKDEQFSIIPVVVGRRRKHNCVVSSRNKRRRVLISIRAHGSYLPSAVNGLGNRPSGSTDVQYNGRAPSLFVLNAAALTKPHAVQQLNVDLNNYGCEVAVITETHMKTKHTDAMMNISEYSLHRRDRHRRRGGGVAVYASCTLQSTVWTYTGDDPQYELLWVRVAGTYIGALYHPPRPQYRTESLLDYIEACVDELCHIDPAAKIVMAGDFNQLSDGQVMERTGLVQIVQQSTRGQNVLDRIFVAPATYNTVRVVTSVVRSDHKTVVAYPEHARYVGKTAVQKTYRKISPAQHAVFLQNMLNVDLSDIGSMDCTDMQSDIDKFYDITLSLLEQYYPERRITMSSRDPSFVTPAMKAKLRRKNRLMRAGRIEKADALAKQIGKDIANRNKQRLRRINPKTCSKDMWAAVRSLTGRRRDSDAVSGITADSLNRHYASISSDTNYQPPQRKHTAACRDQEAVSEWQVFQFLDTLSTTAAGMDKLPAWFLRIGAPFFYQAVTRLFNMSIATSSVPCQWKVAYINPVPKPTAPQQDSDYRPISITPILSRILERIIVKNFLYPAITEPLASLNFSDQYAFRPTGSTTAALIAILHSITDLLSSNPYVIVLAADFSKAFDSVRHSTLMQKTAMLDIPDTVYNWLIDFLSGRRHCTRYNGLTSSMLDISASIIQGSAVGPVSYIINAADLSTVTAGNRIHKYADDTYIVIPATNVLSRAAELDHLSQWALVNNLKLNRAKSAEIIFSSSRHKCLEPHPPELPDIKRVTSITILGVTVTNHLSVSEHVSGLITKCAQSLHALKILRCHGMSDEALTVIYKAVVLAKLVYASPAWWGFTAARDKQRIEAFIRRGVRLRYYGRDDPTFAELVEDTEDTLFTTVLRNSQHVLHNMLPDKRTYTYCLRPRRHELSLTPKGDSRNFFERQLYKDMY